MTLICQEIPLLANQSACDSRYLWGKNFIAQSWVIEMELSSSSSKTSARALSCCTDLSKCAFHASKEWTACLYTYSTSSRSSLLELMTLVLRLRSSAVHSTGNFRREHDHIFLSRASLWRRSARMWYSGPRHLKQEINGPIYTTATKPEWALLVMCSLSSPGASSKTRSAFLHSFLL